MYQVGSLVLYGSTGVCRIMAVATQDVQGLPAEQLYYTLKPLHQDCMIYAPVDSDKIFMRPVISRAEAERLIDMIPSMQAEAFHNRTLRELVEHYKEILHTHDCADLIGLTMSIYAKKQLAEGQRRKLGSVDERFMKRAEELLFGELAVALDMEPSDVPKYITARIKAVRAEAAGSSGIPCESE